MRAFAAGGDVPGSRAASPPTHAQVLVTFARMRRKIRTLACPCCTFLRSLLRPFICQSRPSKPVPKQLALFLASFKERWVANAHASAQASVMQAVKPTMSPARGANVTI